MTTVAFVTYSYQGERRRVGPVELESAETLAREFSRRQGVKDVLVEEWARFRVEEIPCVGIS